MCVFFSVFQGDLPRTSRFREQKSTPVHCVQLSAGSLRHCMTMALGRWKTLGSLEDEKDVKLQRHTGVFCVPASLAIWASYGLLSTEFERFHFAYLEKRKESLNIWDSWTQRGMKWRSALHFSFKRESGSTLNRIISVDSWRYGNTKHRPGSKWSLHGGKVHWLWTNVCLKFLVTLSLGDCCGPGRANYKYDKVDASSQLLTAS